MFGDQLWPILFAASFAVNLLLLCRPLLARLRRGETVSEDNIMAMVEEGEESGSIQSSEKELIENVFEFDTLTARDLMVHRTDMETLALDDDEQTILDTIRRSGLSRFPVYKEDADDIVGILSTREYLLNFHLAEKRTMRQLLRPAYFVPETVSADVLFRDMQAKKFHMAMVVDEYGGTSGLVTLEDLLEELVGTSTMSLTLRKSWKSSRWRMDAGAWPAPPIWKTCLRPWAASCPKMTSGIMTLWAGWFLHSCL